MVKTQLLYVPYEKIRGLLRPGDVIAFSGHDLISDAIKDVTHSTISHVGVVLQTKVLLNGRPQAGVVNSIIESTSLNGFNGVTINRLSDRLASYEGEVFWLPLDLARRKRADFAKFFDYLMRQDHKGYDLPAAVRAGLASLPLIGRFFRRTYEDLRRDKHFMCSQLVTAGLVTAGFLPDTIVPENVTPADLASLKVYRKNYYRISPAPGDVTVTVLSPEIPRFNSVDLGDTPSIEAETAAEAAGVVEDQQAA